MNGIFREIFVDDCLHIFCVDDFEIFKVNGGGNKKEEVFDKIRQIKGNKLKQKEIEVETLDFESQVLNVTRCRFGKWLQFGVQILLFIRFFYWD